MNGSCTSRLAAQAKFLYGGHCQICGLTQPLEVHHMRPVDQGGDDTLDNLVVLCRACHGDAHLTVPASETLLSIWARNRTALIQIGYLKPDLVRQRLECEQAADGDLIDWCSRTFARNGLHHSYQIPDRTLLDELLFLRKKLGRPIRPADIAKGASHSLKTYENRFYRFTDLLQAINDEVAARQFH